MRRPKANKQAARSARPARPFWKRRMSPEHRKAVQRFFQRGEGDK